MSRITVRRFLKYLLLLPFSPLLLLWWILCMLWRGWCRMVRLCGFRRIDAYILKRFLTTYFFMIVLIITVAIIFDFNEKIDKLTGTGATWQEIVFDYYGNFIPYFSNMFSPLFIFIAVIFFTTNLASNSEIIAMKSTGMSFRRLLVPYFLGALVVAIMSFVLGGWVIPHGNVERLAFENKHVKKRQMVDVAENVQMQVDTGVVAYISFFDNRTKSGSGFILDRLSEKKLVEHLTAETIQYDTLADHKYSWTIYNYRLRKTRGARDFISTGQKMDTTIMMEPKDFFYSYGQQETMTISELDYFIARQRLRGSAGLAQFEVEYHKRFASPFAAFILTLIGVSFSSEKRKGGKGTAIGIGLALTFTYIMFQTVSSSFAINAGWPAMIAVWMPNIIFTLIAAWCYKRTPQ